MPRGEIVSKLLAKAATQFANAGFGTPELDAKLLMQHVTGFSSAELISKSRDALNNEKVAEFLSCVHRRLNHEPVHRILGYREFYGREFCLTQETLIPRPDTETLVEEVLKKKPLKILEIGTGSGAIAVSLACELPETMIVATDISADALKTAAKNAEVHGVRERIKFIQADLYDGIEGDFDALVSNPPYIPTQDMKSLQQEVRMYDPLRALDGGHDGLDFYRFIFEGAKHYLRPFGNVFLEFGIGQEIAVADMAIGQNFDHIDIIKDLNQVDRVLVARC